MKNFYKVLEVNENASQEVIEKAYKVLVKKYHPDLQGDTLAANKKIKEINEAYDVLSDTFLKEQYDKELQKELNRNENNYQESDYSRLYREKENLKYQLAHEKTKLENSKNEEEKEDTPSYGIVSLLRTMFSNKPKFKGIKNIQKVDIIAFFLTIVVILVIGLVLYFLPFTHDWMNENFIDTPLINWIKRIF